MEVHTRLGHGFLESVYQEALALEFDRQKIPYTKEVELPIFYRDVRLKTSYRADFICYGDVLVELKALSNITGVEESQVINYLKTTGLEIGLLINFGEPSLRYKRIVKTHNYNAESYSNYKS